MTSLCVFGGSLRGDGLHYEALNDKPTGLIYGERNVSSSLKFSSVGVRGWNADNELGAIAVNLTNLHVVLHRV